MRQRINADCRCQMRRRCERKQRIDDCNARKETRTAEHHFNVSFSIRNHGDFRDFAACPTGSRDGNQRRAGVWNFIYAHVIGEIAIVCQLHGDAFTAVNRTAAADADNHIARFVSVLLEPIRDVLQRRFWGDIGEARCAYPCGVKMLRDFVRVANFCDARVGDN